MHTCVYIGMCSPAQTWRTENGFWCPPRPLYAYFFKAGSLPESGAYIFSDRLKLQQTPEILPSQGPLELGLQAWARCLGAGI